MANFVRSSMESIDDANKAIEIPKDRLFSKDGRTFHIVEWKSKCAAGKVIEVTATMYISLDPNGR